MVCVCVCACVFSEHRHWGTGRGREGFLEGWNQNGELQTDWAPPLPHHNLGQQAEDQPPSFAWITSAQAEPQALNLSL